MSEPEKPKRKFWQFHLSTAILLMLGAGGLLWMNARQRITYYPGPRMSGHPGDNSGWLEYGWPFAFLQIDGAIFEDIEDVQKNERRISIATDLNPKQTVLFLNGFLDGLVSIATLSGCAFVSERLIRHREARKT